jgi:cell division protein ZipA
MELSVQNWMIIVGVLLIVVVLFDGFRRVRSERRGRIRMALNKQYLNSSDDEEKESFTSELPAGGARTVSRKKYFGSSQSKDHTHEKTSDDESVDLDLEQDVPMLMESVDKATTEFIVPQRPDTDDSEPRQLDLDDMVDNFDEEELDEELEDEEFESSVVEPSEKREVEDVFVINVTAKNEPFKGPDLLHILLACDLRYGDMNIFHRHEGANGSGAVQFSVANGVHPGIFDLDAIDQFTSPSVSFFMSVPGPKDAMQAFDFMVETAQCLVKNLGGELCDESRSVMTRQTLEHCRQRIREFERRQLTQHA